MVMISRYCSFCSTPHIITGFPKQLGVFLSLFGLSLDCWLVVSSSDFGSVFACFSHTVVAFIAVFCRFLSSSSSDESFSSCSQFCSLENSFGNLERFYFSGICWFCSFFWLGVFNWFFVVSWCSFVVQFACDWLACLRLCFVWNCYVSLAVRCRLPFLVYCYCVVSFIRDHSFLLLV